MLRLIIKNGNGQVRKPFADDGPECVDLQAYRVFEIEHKVLEEYVKGQRDGQKPINLIAIEIFIAPPAPPPVPATYTPSATGAAAQAELLSVLEKRRAAKQKPLWKFWLAKPEVKPINLPG